MRKPRKDHSELKDNAERPIAEQALLLEKAVTNLTTGKYKTVQVGVLRFYGYRKALGGLGCFCRWVDSTAGSEVTRRGLQATCAATHTAGGAGGAA